jgi:methionyl-tRNA synthetase
MADKRKTLVTAALPYANGPLHLGHMLEYVQADIFTRFLRLSGKDVVFVCADDAHGAPIEIAASKQNLKPEQIIQKYAAEHSLDFDGFLISFDAYHTTHSQENKEFSDFFFNTLKDAGHIYDRMVEQTYCDSCKRYLPDRFVRGTCPKCRAQDQYGDQCEKCGSVYKPTEVIKPECSICGSVPGRKSSVHYFFRLSSFSERVRKWLESGPVQPEIKNFVMNWIKAGLEDWDITRDGPYFGFRIPGELNKYYYVWLDAPIGYIAATEKYARQHNLSANDFWKGNADIIHFIGKDIVYFHLLFWPAMLMGVQFALPSDVIVHGHLTVNGEKMSKSRGNFLTARDYLEKYDPELLRFYYASSLSKNSSDSNLDFADFQARINNDLVSNIANFFYRVLSFINNNSESKIAKLSVKDESFLKGVQKKLEEASASYKTYDFKSAVKHILEASTLGNKYFQDNMPWKLVKEDKKRCAEVLAASANAVKNISIVLTPIMPKFSERIQKQMALPALSIKDLSVPLEGQKIAKARIILTQLEETPSLVPDAFPANLRVGIIQSVENHPDAVKLYVLKVSIGSETRQLVAGLREFFQPEELLNRKVVIVANLKPAKIRGVQSNGMLLAAEKKGKLVLLEAPKSSPGDLAVPEGMAVSDKQITLKEFLELSLLVESRNVFYSDKALETKAEKIIAPIDDGAKIR